MTEISDVYATMDDRALALALYKAESDWESDADEIVYALNEICHRLDLPLDETERGLTKWASDRVDEFLARHGSVRWTRDLA